MLGIMILLIIGTSIWVYFDVKALGEGQIQWKGIKKPGDWLVASILFWIIVFPLYLAKKSEFKRKSN